MVVGESYKASMAHKKAIGANRGDLADVSEKPGSPNTEAEHVETIAESEEPLGKRKKIKRHFKRFWCCYLVAGIIFLAIFLPVFFLVAIPAIAQRIVNDTELPVYNAHIMDPKPGAVTFTLDTSLHIPLGLTVRIDPLELNLFNRDSDPQVDYLAVPIPEYSLKGTTNISVTSHDTPVMNEDEFIKSLTMAVYSKRFILSARGKTTGHLGALKAPLTLDKDVELDGLDQLRGFSIDEAALLLPPLADGTNLRGKATLPNHSIVTFALGNVTLNLMSGDLRLGTALIQNVVLQPGNNSVEMTGKLDIATAIANISPLLKSQQRALENGEIELSASGNQTVYNGEHIPYFETVLNGLTISARVPIVKLLLDTVEQFLGDGSEGIIEALANFLDKLDIGKLFQNIDFDAILDSIGNIVNGLDLNKLFEGLDLTELLNSIDWEKVNSAIVGLLQQLDVGGFLQSMDIGALISSINWSSLITSLTAVLANVDWTSLVETLSQVLDKLDIGAIINAVAPLLQQIDFGAILQNLDLGKIIGSLITAVSTVDWASVFKNIDFAGIINALAPILKNLDLAEILKNIDLPSIITAVGEALKNIDLSSLLQNIDISSIISGLSSLLQNFNLSDFAGILSDLDLGSILSSIVNALKGLDLGSLFDGITIGGVNLGNLLEGLANSSSSSNNSGGGSLADALSNLEDVANSIGNSTAS